MDNKLDSMYILRTRIVITFSQSQQNKRQSYKTIFRPSSNHKAKNTFNSDKFLSSSA